ncbi:MAG: PIN domain-containing protein [Terriglobales bacterium]|jgi:predicted nucleic acid-binding protein
MSGADFLDTNVLVYAYQFNDREKQRVARELVRKAVAGKFVFSTQVLSEFASTMLHKASPPATHEAMISILDRLSPIKLVTPDAGLIRRAVEAQSAYGLHFYDCMIIAAAERGGCERIWSEDFNAGQKYFGVIVTNPFE